ncbi:MAG: hypothetical protein NTY70_19560 [Burkholderiales bacterium]|nr:hypothetical protein [Burkholderiales bacterium]
MTQAEIRFATPEDVRKYYLGAAHNPKLVGKMAAEVGKAVRATDINWAVTPTLEVGSDAYEIFSEDASVVREYGAAYLNRLQGTFERDANVVATAKHFIGDDGTDRGTDRSVSKANLAQMLNQHAQVYCAAFATGAHTVVHTDKIPLACLAAKGES